MLLADRQCPELPWEHRRRAYETVDKQATALALNISQYWSLTVGCYLGRVTNPALIVQPKEIVVADSTFLMPEEVAERYQAVFWLLCFETGTPFVSAHSS